MYNDCYMIRTTPTLSYLSYPPESRNIYMRDVAPNATSSRLTERSEAWDEFPLPRVGTTEGSWEVENSGGGSGVKAPPNEGNFQPHTGGNILLDQGLTTGRDHIEMPGLITDKISKINNGLYLSMKITLDRILRLCIIGVKRRH